MIGTVIMILAILIFAILPTLKNRIISVRKLLITPIIFLLLLCHALNDFNLQITDIPLLLLSVIIGIVCGILLRRQTVVKTDKQNALIALQGSYQSLFIFLLLFSIHFIIGYITNVQPHYVATHQSIRDILLFSLTACSNLMIGGNLLLFFRYFNNPSACLKPSFEMALK